MYYQIKQLFKHRNLRLVDFVYRFVQPFFIELSSYSKSRLTDDTYLRKTKSLLDHFKPSLARDRLFVIVVFVHPSSKMARYGQDVKAAFLSP
jgi:hypothetical protein